jgi:hypothetical protein
VGGLLFLAAASDPIAAQWGRYGISTPKLQDFALVAGVYLAGLLFLHLGYRAGGRTWVRRHGLVWRAGKKRRLVSGFYPEMLIFTACALLVLVVDLAIPNVTLLEIITRQWTIALGVLAFVFAVVASYSVHTVRAARNDPGETRFDRKRLARAYTLYAPYTISFFCGGALVLVMLAREFGYDQAAFDREAAGVRALFAAAQALRAAHLHDLAADGARASLDYAQALSTIETAFGRISLATTLLQDQMNPVFIFATAVFAINILIRFTPARNAFLDGARNLTLISTAAAIGLCVLFGLYVYFYSYSAMLDDAAQRLAGLSPSTRLGAWDMTRRYNEVFVSLNDSKNLFGFLKAIGGEGSGMATFVFGVQFALDRIQEREEKKPGAAEILPYKDWRAARRAV